MNGIVHEHGSSADQVHRYLQEVTRLVSEWIKTGELSDTPVTRFANGREARQTVQLRISQTGLSDAELFAQIQSILENSVNPWTGRFLDKLYTAPLPLGVATEALLGAINANAHIMSASPMLCLAEEVCVEALASLCGWDSTLADGITMPGGSSSNTLALQTALNNTFPTYSNEGIAAFTKVGMQQGRSMAASRPLLFTSAEGHYSIDKAAIACGLGLKSVVKVPCDEFGRMDAAELNRLLHESIDDKDGSTTATLGMPIFVNATAGSTVMGAFDPLDEIAAVISRYNEEARTKDIPNIWLHVDGSWGGPILFSKSHKQRMNGIEHCQSLTINPHKLLNIPLQCSFALFRNGDALSANALDAPYLFHDTSAETPANAVNQIETLKDRDAFINRKRKRRESPAQMNFGCGRRGDALKMYLIWLSKGSDYFGNLVDEGIRRAEQLVEKVARDVDLQRKLEIALLPSGMQFLQVCVRPRLRPDSTTPHRSAATQAVYSELRKRRHFAVDFAPLSRGRGDFLRMVTHPTTPLPTFIQLLEEIAAIGASIG